MPNKIKIIGLVLIGGWLLVAGSRDARAQCPSGVSDQRCESYDELMAYLTDDARKNTDFRMLPVLGGNPVGPRHRQYSKACFFFAINTVLEQLGFTRFFPGENYDRRISYYNGTSMVQGDLYDVGFWGSPEHVMLDFLNLDSFNRSLSGYTPVADTLASTTSFPSNTNNLNCWGVDRFVPGEYYGECSAAADQYPDWMNDVSSGTSWNPAGGSNSCGRHGDALCNGMWYLNNYRLAFMGATDARGFYPKASSHLPAMRTLIRAFIDQGIPLLASTRAGGHWVAVVGYAELDDQGLPRTAILADSTARQYWLASGIHLYANWHNSSTSTNDGRDSLHLLYPWNHHLLGGCDSGGWAAELDANELAGTGFEICNTPDDRTVLTSYPKYGLNIACIDNGSVRERFIVTPENPFIQVDHNRSCDRLKVEHRDGSTWVTSAKAVRYAWNSTSHRWDRLSRYSPDALQYFITDGFPGRRSVVDWDGVWRDNYWLVASTRRTTLELSLSDGRDLWVEIAPPETYGVRFTCHRNNRDNITYFVEASEHFASWENTSTTTQEQYVFIPEAANRTCDSVAVQTFLGHGTEDLMVVDAFIERFRYRESDGDWRRLSYFSPSSRADTAERVSGHPAFFSFEGVWPASYWLSAENLSGSQDRKTRLTLELSDGSETIFRTLEIFPH